MQLMKDPTRVSNVYFDENYDAVITQRGLGICKAIADKKIKQ